MRILPHLEPFYGSLLSPKLYIAFKFRVEIYIETFFLIMVKLEVTQFLFSDIELEDMMVYFSLPDLCRC